MKALLVSARLLVAVVVALVVTLARRLARGPSVPSWSWGVEVRVSALRALIRAADGPDVADGVRRLEARWSPALPRHVRGVIRVEQTSLAGVPGEWIVPAGADDVTDAVTLLYLHGGAYVAGSPATHRRFVSRLTLATQAKTYVPAYRLAPAHPFPAAVDDAEAVYRALVEAGADPARLVLAGDSAGGGLACALLLRIRNAGLKLPAGAMLFSPYTDLEHTGDSIVRNAATDFIPLPAAIEPNLRYLGPADPRDPFASPLYGDLTGLPPLLVFAGGREMALDDSLRLADRARAAGVDVDLQIEPDMFHVWPAIVPTHPASLKALTHAGEWVTARLRADAPLSCDPTDAAPAGS